MISDLKCCTLSRRPLRPAQSSQTRIVAMARPKASDWRSLSPEQIQEEIAKSKRALYDWRVAKATRQVRQQVRSCLLLSACMQQAALHCRFLHAT